MSTNTLRKANKMLRILISVKKSKAFFIWVFIFYL
jgi:hypothetical protein